MRRYSGCVDEHAPVPPEGLRPAQLGVVLVGRVVSGHIGATVADLAARGYLRMEGSASDWLLTDLRPPNAPASSDLLRYEEELLAGLFDGGSEEALSKLGAPFVSALGRVRIQLVADAVRSGRLSRWRRGKRTRRGEELLAAVQTFRRGLRAAAVTGDLAPAHVPYAMAFGLSHGPAPQLPPGTPAGRAVRRGEPDVPKSSSLWSPSTQSFGGIWQETCSRLAEPYGGRLPGFAHQWTDPQHSPSGHHQSHGTWSGGHGNSSGGHAGGHTGGHL